MECVICQEVIERYESRVLCNNNHPAHYDCYEEVEEKNCHCTSRFIDTVGAYQDLFLAAAKHGLIPYMRDVLENHLLADRREHLAHELIYEGYADALIFMAKNNYMRWNADRFAFDFALLIDCRLVESIPLIDAMRDCGLDVAAPLYPNCSLAELAVGGDKPEVLRYLQDHCGINLASLRVTDGSLLTDYAREHNAERCVEFLEATGAARAQPHPRTK